MTFTDEEKEAMLTLVNKALESFKEDKKNIADQDAAFFMIEKKYENILKSLKEKLN